MASFDAETPPVPGEALREAVLNAVAHRDYGNPAPIQIRVYDDHIALWNPGALPPDWTLDKLMGTHSSAPHNPGIANAFFRAGMVEAWGRGIGGIVRACRSAGTAKPQWVVEPGGLRLEFVFTGAGYQPQSRKPAGEPTQEDPDTADEMSRGDRPRPEPQPESQPESLAVRVLQQLADGPMSKADLSGRLGQKQISGQLNKVIRVLVAAGSIGYTIPEKPRSRLQMYRLTGKGQAAIKRLPSGTAEK